MPGGVAAGAVLVWRVLLPLAVNLRHRLRVTAVVPEAPGVWSVHVAGRRLDLLRAEPGQFLLYLYDMTEVFDLRRLLGEKAGFHDMVGGSAAMATVSTSTT